MACMAVKGERLVVSKSLRRDLMQCLHYAHSSTDRAWVVRSSNTLRRVIFVEPMTRDSLNLT